jgi:hypothetical protein
MEDHGHSAEIAKLNRRRPACQRHGVSGIRHHLCVLTALDRVTRHVAQPFSNKSTSWLSKIICGVIFDRGSTAIRDWRRHSVDRPREVAIPSKFRMKVDARMVHWHSLTNISKGGRDGEEINPQGENRVGW